MSLVPSNNAGLSKREAWQRDRAVRNAEIDVFDYSLGLAVEVEKERRAAQATADVMNTALDEEIAMLNDGLDKAGTSDAAVELVARKVNLFAGMNNKRIVETFGR